MFLISCITLTLGYMPSTVVWQSLQVRKSTLKNQEKSRKINKSHLLSCHSTIWIWAIWETLSNFCLIEKTETGRKKAFSGHFISEVCKLGLSYFDKESIKSYNKHTSHDRSDIYKSWKLGTWTKPVKSQVISTGKDFIVKDVYLKNLGQN